MNCIVNQIDGFSLSYCLCLLEASFLDVETSPGLQRPVPVACLILCSSVLDLTMASSAYDKLLSSETFDSDRHHVSESCWFPDSVALSCYARARCFGPK